MEPVNTSNNLGHKPNQVDPSLGSNNAGITPVFDDQFKVSPSPPEPSPQATLTHQPPSLPQPILAATPEPIVVSAQRAYSPPAISNTDLSYDGSQFDSSLESSVSDMVPISAFTTPAKVQEGLPVERFPLFRFNRTAFMATTAALGIITIIGVVTFGLSGLTQKSSKGSVSGSNNSIAAQYAVSSIPLSGLSASIDLSVSDANLLVINGLLQVNGSLVLNPSNAPNTPVTGQIYYDKSTSLPYFYNGQSFVSFDQPNVSSIAGNTGAFALGQGLQISGNQIGISSTLLQQVASALSASLAPKVSSIQGLNGDVSLVSGSGITITGTTIINNGVTGLTGTANQIAVSNSTGSVTLSLPQDIGTSSSPTFSSQTLGQGGTTTGSLVLNNSGNVYTTTLQGQSSASQNQIITIPASSSITDIICLQSLANCSGVGTTAGTQNYITKYSNSSATQLTNSLLFDNGVSVGIATNTPNASYKLDVNGSFNSSSNINSTGGAFQINGSSINVSGVLTNVAYLNQANTFIAAGTALTVSNSAAINGTLTAGGIIVGVAGSTNGSINFTNNSNIQLGNLSIAAPSGVGNASYTIPSIAGGSSDTFCLVGVGNCAGSGSVVTTSGGTINNIPKFSASQAVTNSSISDDGTTVTVSNILSAGTFTASLIQSTGALSITPSGALTVGATTQAFKLQGSLTSQLSATDPSTYTTNVGFSRKAPNGAPTGNITYNFQNDSSLTPGTYYVCTMVGNCAGVGGGVTTSGGTVGAIAKFTASGNIADSILSEASTTVNVAGNLSVGISNSGSVNYGLIFNNYNNAFAITLKQSATPPGASATINVPNVGGTLAVSAAGPLALDATTGALTCSTCLTSGGGGGTSGVTSLNLLTGVLSINNTTGSGVTITIDNASTAAKGIAQFNSTNFTASSGTINTIQDIASTSNPTFANLIVQGATGLTLGNALNLGQALFKDGTASGFTQTLSPATLSASRSITIPNASGTLAVSASGNLSLSALGAVTISDSPTFSTSVTTPSLTSAGALTVSGGTTLALTSTGVNNTSLDTGGAATVNVGATNATTIQIGKGTATVPTIQIQGNAVTVASTNATNSTTLGFAGAQAAGNITYNFDRTASTGTYTVCTSIGNCLGGGGGANTALSNLSSVAINTSLLPASNNTIDAGSVALGFRSGYFSTSILTPTVDTASVTTLNIGATNASAITIGNVANTTGTTFRSQNSVTAFQIQNATGTSLLTADTTNSRINIGTSGTPTGQLYISGTVPTSAAGSVATGSDPRSVVVSGRYAYVANTTANTLQIFDVSNPASPVSVGSVATGTGPRSVVVSGRYAYVANQTASTLQIFDVSNPASPVSVGSVATGANPSSVVVSGRYAYVANSSSNTLQIFDIVSPTAPVSVGSVATGANPVSVVVSGRYAYVTNYNPNTLQIFDISNPASPVSVGSVATGTGPFSVVVSGRYAYVVNFSFNTLQIFDISNPTAPVSVGSVATGTQPSSVVVSGRYAYVAHASSNTLQIFDIVSPTAPVSVGSIATTSGSLSVVVSGRYAYVANFSANTLQVFDIGGTYSQSLEAGSIETGGLRANNDFSVGGNTSLQGGLQVGQSLQVSGNFGASGQGYFGGTLAVTGATTISAANALTVGLTGTNTGAVLFKGATAASGTLTVIGQTNPTNNTLTLPNETGTVCTTAAGGACSALGFYIQNQIASQQSTSNFWISGSGRADTSILTPTLDAATAGTLSLGTSTATAVTIGRTGITTTNAGALTVTQLLTANAGATVANGAIALTGNASSSFTTSSGALTLTGAAASTFSTASGQLTIQSGSGTVSLGSSTALTATGALTVSGGTTLALTSTGVNNTSLDTGGAATVNVGATNATTIQIGKGTATVPTIQIQGNAVTVASTNATNSTTLGFAGAQAAGNITYNFDRTASTGTYTVCTTLLGSCSTAGAGFIQNQSSTPGSAQTGNFNISGTGIAATALSTPSLTSTGVLALTSASGSSLTVTSGGGGALTLDSGTTGTVSLGTGAGSKVIIIGDASTVNTGNTQAINVGTLSVAGTTNVTVGSTTGATAGTTTLQSVGTLSVGNVISPTINIQGAAAGTVNVGNNAVANTIQIGTTATNTGNTQAINIGNLAAAGTTNVTVGSFTGATAGSTTLQAFGTLALQVATGGTLNIGANGLAKTIQIGQTTAAVTDTIGIGNSAFAGSVSNLTIGNLLGASTTTINAGTGNLNLSTNSATASVIVKNSTASTTAFQVQNASGTSLLTADTTNSRINIGTSGTPTGQLYISGTVPTSAVGQIATGANPRSVAISGHYAYEINQSTNTLNIFDVSNSASPVSVGSVGTGTQPYAVVVAGHYAYVANYSANNMQIFDVSNPSGPVSVGSASTGNGTDSVAVSGRYAYVTTDSGRTLEVIDVSNPAHPVNIGSVATGPNPSSVAISGRYAYVTYNSGTLKIYDISNPAVPTSAGLVAVVGASAVAVSGRYAYVSIASSTLLQVIDVSNPSSPVAVSPAGSAGSGTYSIAISGRYAYITNLATNNLQVIDISAPATPVLVGNITTGSQPMGVAVSGRYAYVVNNAANTLQIFDIGGTYSQSLEAGSIETGGLRVNNDFSVGGNTSLQGGLQVGQSVQISGDLGSNGTAKFSNSTNSVTAFQVQNAAGNQIFGIDTTNSLALLGKASTLTGALVNYNSTNANTVTIASGITSANYTLTLPTAIGTAGQCLSIASIGGSNAQLGYVACGPRTKKVNLTPEYSGAVLTSCTVTGGGACGGSDTNNGTMTSGFDPSVANGGPGYMSYYNWTSTQAAAQTYDVLVRVPVPSDWSSWTSSNMTLYYYDDNNTNTALSVQVAGYNGSTNAYDVGSSGVMSAVTLGTVNNWNTATYSLTSASYSADGYATIRIRMSAANSSNLRLGNITLTYNSAY